jgi:hypothetical protein
MSSLYEYLMYRLGTVPSLGLIDHVTPIWCTAHSPHQSIQFVAGVTYSNINEGNFPVYSSLYNIWWSITVLFLVCNANKSQSWYISINTLLQFWCRGEITKSCIREGYVPTYSLCYTILWSITICIIQNYNKYDSNIQL